MFLQALNHISNSIISVILIFKTIFLHILAINCCQVFVFLFCFSELSAGSLGLGMSYISIRALFTIPKSFLVFLPRTSGLASSKVSYPEDCLHTPSQFWTPHTPTHNRPLPHPPCSRSPATTTQQEANDSVTLGGFSAACHSLSNAGCDQGQVS